MTDHHTAAEHGYSVDNDYDEPELPVRCPVCRTSGTDPHEPGSAECLDTREERRLAHTDDEPE